MSLAMYASEFNNENMENNPIQKKREIARNKTLKRREPVKSNANIDVLKKRIQYDDGDEDEDETSVTSEIGINVTMNGNYYYYYSKTFSFLLKFKSKNAEQETKNKFELSLESHTSEHYSIIIRNHVFLMIIGVY